MITRYVVEGSSRSRRRLPWRRWQLPPGPCRSPEDGRVCSARGHVDAVMRTLLARGLIEEAGHDPESGAVLFATTTYFLERMGLRSCTICRR